MIEARLHGFDLRLDSIELLLDGKDILDAPRSVQQLPKAFAKRKIISKSRLEIGILLRDVGGGYRTALLFTKAGDGVHDLVKPSGWDPASEPDARFLGCHGAIDKAT